MTMIALENHDSEQTQAYKKALDDFQKKFETWLRNLPQEIANDLRDLFQLRAKAFSDGDTDAMEEISQAIREILVPDSLKEELQKSFFEEDPAIRKRLDSYRANVGLEIKKRRELLHMTQDQLADLAGIPQSHVCRLEHGKHVPTFTTIEKLAKALDTTPSQLDPGIERNHYVSPN